jgi:hypothetical protein
VLQDGIFVKRGCRQIGHLQTIQYTPASQICHPEAHPLHGPANTPKNHFLRVDMLQRHICEAGVSSNRSFADYSVVRLVLF